MLKKYWKDFAIFWGIFVVFVGGVFLFFYLISEGKLGFMPTFEELENPTSNFAAEIYSADGEIIGKYFMGNENRRYTDYSEIAPCVVDALIATEDVRFYDHSGIEAAAKAAGAKVMPAHQESYYRAVSLPQAKKLKSAKIHEAILDCDVWINVPILKNHGGANLTMSMKNHMGIVWDRGAFHQLDLQQCIADICTLEKKAVLNVVDAYRVLKTNGPRGRSASDVVLAKGLFISQDIVAVDTAAAKFFNQVRSMPLDRVKHLANAQALNIGTMDLDKLNIKRIKI